MDPSEIAFYVRVAVILFVASIVQGTVGFAAGLLAIPLLVLVAGASMPVAIMTVLLAAFVQNANGLFHLRKDLEFREAVGPMLVRIAFIPLGVWVLHLTNQLPHQHAKVILGVVLLGLVLAQHFLAPNEAVELRPIWKWIAFTSSGFLVGFCGMGGPPMVLWVMAQPWSAAKSRAFMFCLFLSSLIPHCLLLYFTFGNEIAKAAIMAVISIPLILAGTWLGLYLGGLLPKYRLRVLVFWVLVLTALSAIAAPFWQPA